MAPYSNGGARFGKQAFENTVLREQPELRKFRQEEDVENFVVRSLIICSGHQLLVGWQSDGTWHIYDMKHI